MLFIENGYVNFETPLAVVVSAAFWRASYYISRWCFSDQSPEYSSRFITFCHGLIISFLGINECFVLDSPFDHPDWRTTYVQSFILVASLGYFIHDTAWCMYHGTEGNLMLFHHVYCVFALCRMLFKGSSGAQATCSLGSMEITNPFLQARWFIRSKGLYPSVIHTSVETTFFLVFVLIRIVLGTYYMWIIWNQPKNDMEFVFLSLTIYIMSWLFVFSMIEYIIKKKVRTTTRNEIVSKTE